MFCFHLQRCGFLAVRGHDRLTVYLRNSTTSWRTTGAALAGSMGCRPAGALIVFNITTCSYVPSRLQSLLVGSIKIPINVPTVSPKCRALPPLKPRRRRRAERRKSTFTISPLNFAHFQSRVLPLVFIRFGVFSKCIFHEFRVSVDSRHRKVGTS